MSDAPAPAALSPEEEKKRKAEEKEKRRLEFEAQKAAGGIPVKVAPKTADERREIQEKQRADKERLKQEKQGTTPAAHVDPTATAQQPSRAAHRGSDAGTIAPQSAGQQPQQQSSKKQPTTGGAKPSTALSVATGVHPAVYQMGLWMKEMYIVGSNPRCIGMLLALKAWMSSIAALNKTTPFIHDAFAGTKKALSTQLSFLESSRMKSIGMGNAIRLLKAESEKISTLKPTPPEHEAYKMLCNFVDFFISEKIDFAKDKMAKHGLHMIQHNDVILTYVNCSAVKELFIRAGKLLGKSFHVIIVDCPPLYEGRKLMIELSSIPTIETTYCLITSLKNVIGKVTKVFLGSSAILSNGEIFSRSGTATVALTAKSFHLPVIFFCETYKFTNKVFVRSLTNNEERIHDGVQQYMYDLTPVSLVDVIITEYGPTAPTTVGTVLRDKTEQFGT